MKALQLIPTMAADQRMVFSGRLWHELHGWLRVEVRRVYDIMQPAVEFLAIGSIETQGRMGLPGWDEKIADLFNHGLDDEEISDYFTAEQACNFIRDYSAALRRGLEPDEDHPATTECSNVIDDRTCEEREAREPCSLCHDRMKRMYVSRARR